MRKRENYLRLYAYVGREYILSFVVSFLFFFFIFFVNQILVLAQKIMLKSVGISDVLLLVVLSIPQFLMYTMPFSSLASASMVIGNLSTQNEILALRSSGIHTKHVFRPILVLSVVLSILTLVIADKMIPSAAEGYKVLYNRMMESVPTLQLESYGSTQFGNIVISNGLVKDNVIYDVIVFDDSDQRQSKVISAEEGTVEVLDAESFLYRIDLKNPSVLMTDNTSKDSYSYAQAQHMSLYLDLSSNIHSAVSIKPSQMSLAQLETAIDQSRKEQDSISEANFRSLSRTASVLGELLLSVENQASDVPLALSSASSVRQLQSSQGFSFYYQYYRSEFHKKLALSLACTFLVFLAFPISFLKVKNGRLIGFGASMLIACAYWFFIYFMHLKAVSSALNPALFLWAPNAVVFLLGIIMLWRSRK